MKTLVIAEKPAVAQEIAKVLNAKDKKGGYYEGKTYIVSWCIGHLITLADPEDYDQKYKVWSTEDLPIIPSPFKTKIISATEKQYHILKNLLNSDNVNEVICATDAGREGELIFRYVYMSSGSTKPVRRLWIQSLTEEAITKGFQELRPYKDFDKLYLSAKAKAEANRLYGFTAKETHEIAQNLYEKKLITYPRTDSRYLSEDLQESVSDIADFILRSDILDAPGLIDEFKDMDFNFDKQVIDNTKITDHHAIIPTYKIKEYNLSELTKDEICILKLIIQRLLVVLSRKHLYAETEILISVNSQLFDVKGRTVIDEGWKWHMGAAPPNPCASCKNFAQTCFKV